jgi:hypothetical protein
LIWTNAKTWRDTFKAQLPDLGICHPDCRAMSGYVLCAELLGLIERAARQRLAGDACRKAEIVINPGRDARLSTEAC